MADFIDWACPECNISLKIEEGDLDGIGGVITVPPQEAEYCPVCGDYGVRSTYELFKRVIPIFDAHCSDKWAVGIVGSWGNIEAGYMPEVGVQKIGWKSSGPIIRDRRNVYISPEKFDERDQCFELAAHWYKEIVTVEGHDVEELFMETLGWRSLITLESELISDGVNGA